MKLFCGNLSWNTTEDTLRAAIEREVGEGTVEDVKIITDRESGRSRGFGFVRMSSRERGEAVIAGLDGYELDGRAINVSEAREKPRQERMR